MVKYINHLKDSKDYYFQIIKEYIDVFERDCNILYFLLWQALLIGPFLLIGGSNY